MCPLGLIHCPWVRGLAQERKLSIKLEVSRRWPEADSFPICKLSVFIYLLLNDLRFKPRGHFSFLEKKKKKPNKKSNSHFSCWSFVTGTSKSSTGVTLNGKFALHLRWMPLKVYPLIPISAYVIPAPSVARTHTFPLPLPTHLLLVLPLHSVLPPSLALIRVMPTHHSIMGQVRQQDM